MSQQDVHTKILNSTARKFFEAKDIKQQGRSRVWIADQKYWLIAIEFQPSDWSKGSYLNVGCMWLFYPQDHIAFNYGHREKELIKYQTEKQFEQAVTDFCLSAMIKVEEYQKKFISLDAICDHLLKIVNQKNTWSFYHAAVACGLTKRNSKAKELFNNIINEKYTFDWEVEIQNKSKLLISQLVTPEKFKQTVIDWANHTRTALKLTPINIEMLK